jgi:hypothetical protein
MKLKLENLQNSLDEAKKLSPELADIFLYTDGRVRNKVALAKRQERENIYTKTDFLTFGEMQQFLRGYMFKAEKRFYN